MPKPAEKLAESLRRLKELQDKGIIAVKSNSLGRVHLERLVRNGFLKKVTKGWYYFSDPSEQNGETSSWYSNYWAFCTAYLNERYGDQYYLSPEHSIKIHAGNQAVPAQLMVRVKRNTNHNTPLLFNTSIWNGEVETIPESGIEVIGGLRMLSLALSLINCPESFFLHNPVDARAALSMIKDSSEITSQLLEGSHSTIAGRLAGAFRNIGRTRIADDIIKTMKSAGYDVREKDPFTPNQALQANAKEFSPHSNRIKFFWESMRGIVIENFPVAPGIPNDVDGYLTQVEQLYKADAYHSLSIERYRVTIGLIEKVKEGNWDIFSSEADKQQRDAMAARGYWQATEKLKLSLAKVLRKENAGKIADEEHGDWYRELFAPSVAAGILQVQNLAGYRNAQVYISGSMHVPMVPSAVREAMPALFELLENESESSVKAVLGHFAFAYIHPYMDGNGRMARFLMNLMLASGGYPWTIIPVQLRDEYMSALESASVELNIQPFAKFLGYLVEEGMRGKRVGVDVG